MPEVVAAGCLKGLGLEFAVGGKLLVYDRPNVALGADLGQQLANGARAQTMEVFYLPSESEIRDDLSRNLADGSERAGVGTACTHAVLRSSTARSSKARGLLSIIMSFVSTTALGLE